MMNLNRPSIEHALLSALAAFSKFLKQKGKVVTILSELVSMASTIRS